MIEAPSVVSAEDRVRVTVEHSFSTDTQSADCMTTYIVLQDAYLMNFGVL